MKTLLAVFSTKKPVDNAFIGTLQQVSGLKEKLNVSAKQAFGTHRNGCGYCRGHSQPKPRFDQQMNRPEISQPTLHLRGRGSKTTSTKIAQTIVIITHNEGSHSLQTGSFVLRMDGL